MGVGHAGIALCGSRFAPRLNVGWLIFASFLADFLLGIFALAGLEEAHVPTDYASRHYLTFTFPYSHGLAALLLWGAAFGALVGWAQRLDRKRAVVVVALAVLSHFVLDALVHVVGLPLLGESSPKIGLGLWNHLPLELCLETAIAIAGIVLYLRVGGAASARSRFGVPAVMLVLAAATWSQLFVATPPQTAQLIPGWLVSPIAFAGIPYLLDRKRAHRSKSHGA